MNECIAVIGIVRPEAHEAVPYGLQFGHAVSMVPCRTFDQPVQNIHALFHNSPVDIVLALEIQVDGALSQFGFPGDFIHGGGFESLLEKDLFSGHKDILNPILFFAGPSLGNTHMCVLTIVQ